MKKLLTVSSSHILMVCGLGLMVTLGSFWHHQTNQVQLDRMNVLNQGVGTCFNRISQTFTAMMIKDAQSPYLDRGFMTLSDECLSETIKGINPFKQNVGKGYETLNKLISEVHWFHESVIRAQANAPLNPISTKFSQMETLKVNLVDQIDETNALIRNVQSNDEVLMGAGLIAFVIALSLLSLKEYSRVQERKEIENKALSLLNAGQTNVGAMVDHLIERALRSQGLNVSAQVFKDYHGELLEGITTKAPYREEKTEAKLEVPEVQDVEPVTVERTSLKEVLLSLQNINSKGLIQVSDVKDVQLNVDIEGFEQLMNSAINKLATKDLTGKKIQISNQVHSDRAVINLFLASNMFTAEELDFAQTSGTSTDMNLILLKEMATETKTQWYLENKADRNGTITGMNIRFTVLRAPKDSRSTKLVSLVKGKKKDLAREMMN